MSAYADGVNDAIPEMVRTLADNIGISPSTVAHNCHGVSLAIVRSGLWPGARVARGWAKGVRGQHSWVVVGDPYDRDAYILDATLWSYDPDVPDVWQGSLNDGIHQPHGAGHFMTGSMPVHQGGETLHLTPATPLSVKARNWLRAVGAPFDNRGWMAVAHLPVEGWPSKEIISAMLDTPQLAVFVPIDIQGMLTDRDPGGLYLGTPQSDDPAPWMKPLPNRTQVS